MQGTNHDTLHITCQRSKQKQGGTQETIVHLHIYMNFQTPEGPTLACVVAMCLWALVASAAFDGFVVV